MFAVYSQSREMDNVMSLAVLLLATSTLLEAVVLAGDNSVLEVWLTTGDGHKKLSHESSVHASQGTNGGQLVTVDRNRHYQTVDGFGAAISNSAAYVIYHSPQRHEIMQTLFGSSGIGISYIRLTMGGSDLQAVPPYTYDDLPSGVATDFNLDHFSIAKDREFIIPILKEAISINPKLKILGSPWTAPAWMKTSHSLFGGAFRAEDRYYQALSQYFLKFIQAYAAEGIPIDSITTQNEPMLSRDSYPTMTMSWENQRDLIKTYLGPLFKSHNIKTKIIIFDHNWSGSDYPEHILADSTASSFIAGVAWHCYEGRHDTPLYFHEKHPHVGMYFTECSGGGWDTNSAGTLAFDMRNLFIGQTRAFAKIVLLWNLALDEHSGPKVGVNGCQDCRGVVTVNSNGGYQKNIEYYSIGHMSKFVQPGAIRLESPYFGWDDLHTVAFKNPDQSVVIVVVNAYSGHPKSFTIELDGKHFQYSNLPNQSVVTFILK
ncbi:hypothetical protein ACJMK2_038724 [Sinanodonta woodiana]|uniref:Glucosylceramidase n=1 Tax=Sinanodonta woodiana TaxID=1069815 RepID=A0ABD3W9U7_SINWO